MPTSPYAKILAVVNAGAPASGGIIIPSAATIALSGENASQWTSQLWQIYDYPLGFTAPSGWSTDANGVIFSTAVAPPSFTLPANTVRWGKMMLRLTVNGGLSNGLPNSLLIDETTALSMLSPNGLRDLAFNETLQFGGSRSQWGAELRAILRTIDGNFGLNQNTLIGDGTGYAQITAANGTIVTTSKGKDTDFFFAATTPNATLATMFTYLTTTNRIISIDGIITLFNGGSGYAKYKLDGLYTNIAGTLTKKSTTPNDVATGPESSVSTDVSLSFSGTGITVNGLGFSSSNSWTGRIFIHEAAF